VYDVKKEDNDEDTAGAVVTAALVHGGEKSPTIYQQRSARWKNQVIVRVPYHGGGRRK
jgi:hypothetical protein